MLFLGASIKAKRWQLRQIRRQVGRNDSHLVQIQLKILKKDGLIIINVEKLDQNVVSLQPNIHTKSSHLFEIQVMLYFLNKIPYACHCNPLLILNCSWILTIHNSRILQKKLLKNPFLTFKNGVKNIQTAGYNGAGTVHIIISWFQKRCNL